MSLEQLTKILRRCEPTKFTREALSLIQLGEMPSDDLLRRCGLRVAGQEVSL